MMRGSSAPRRPRSPCYVRASTPSIRPTRSEGKAERKAEAVLRLLRKRFGPLGPADTHRVTSVDGATLDGMLDRVLTATTLREALG